MTQTHETPAIQVRGRFATSFEILRIRLAGLYREAAKFGVIGIIAMIIDFGIFNLLLLTSFADRPLTARVISVVVATTFAYFGNRFWTFRNRESTSYTREYVLFFVLNGVGLGISLGVLWFSHYALGMTNPVADNIASLVGVVLGTLFRFWSYRKWVFLETVSVIDETPADAAVDSVPATRFHTPNHVGNPALAAENELA